MAVEIDTIPGVAPIPVPPGPQALPPEPQPWQALMELGLLRRNVTAAPGQHARYALTGLGWAAVIGGGWWLLRRRSSSAEEE